MYIVIINKQDGLINRVIRGDIGSIVLENTQDYHIIVVEDESIGKSIYDKPHAYKFDAKLKELQYDQEKGEIDTFVITS